MLTSFDANELELLICGTHDVDVDDWIKNTEYRSGMLILKDFAF